mgnify:CR=1 FL=1
MSLYTESGQKIYNPEAYAKTGAPMYKTKYTESRNINKETYIYKLDLENGKKYVGKTNNVDRRMNQHFNGNGAKVTKKFKPIEGEVIDSCNGYFSSELEQKNKKSTQPSSQTPRRPITELSTRSFDIFREKNLRNRKVRFE